VGTTGPRTDGTAIAALVLAIASFVVCPIIPAVIALALIPGSRRSIASSGGTIDGLGVLTAAKIIALLNVGLLAVGIVVAIIAIVTSGSTTTHSINGMALLAAL
jgi:hypothetical protein